MPTPERLAYTVDEAAEILSIGRSTLYELLTSGKIASVKIGRSRRIRHAAIVAYLDALEETGAA